MIKTLKNIASFYIDGFKNMTLGRTLWAVIIIKLVVIFALLKVFIYDNSLQNIGDSKAQSNFVLENLTQPNLDTSPKQKLIHNPTTKE